MKELGRDMALYDICRSPRKRVGETQGAILGLPEGVARVTGPVEDAGGGEAFQAQQSRLNPLREVTK